MQHADRPGVYPPEIGKIKFDGATGHIEFDEKGDRKDAEMTIFQLKNGNVEPIAIIKQGKTTKVDLAMAPTAAPAAARRQRCVVDGTCGARQWLACPRCPPPATSPRMRRPVDGVQGRHQEIGLRSFICSDGAFCGRFLWRGRRGLPASTPPWHNPHAGAIVARENHTETVRSATGPGRQPRGVTAGKDRLDIFLQQMINGLTLGSVYAIVALGYTMVYSIIQLINPPTARW